VPPPAVAGSGIVSAAPGLTANENDDDYDMSGYDLSRYESNGSGPLAGADDPDAGDEEAGGRRRSRRGGARRRTRP
jgi:ribonuclease E